MVMRIISYVLNLEGHIFLKFIQSILIKIEILLIFPVNKQA